MFFTDFKGFTNIAEKMTPNEVIQELNTCFLAFDEVCDKYGLEKIKTIGDSYMCAGGLPIANRTNPIDVVLAGLEMRKFMTKWKAEKEALAERIQIKPSPAHILAMESQFLLLDAWHGNASEFMRQCQKDNFTAQKVHENFRKRDDLPDYLSELSEV